MADAIRALARRCRRDATLRFRKFITFLPVAPLYFECSIVGSDDSNFAVNSPAGTGSAGDDEGFDQSGQASMMPNIT
jgi:hypothetical protein